jgi:hypothetical protein
MPLEVPSWFKYRQGKAEDAGPNLYKVSAPQLKDAFVGIRPARDEGWQAFFRHAADGPDVAASDSNWPTPGEAWNVAFEMYRREMVV